MNSDLVYKKKYLKYKSKYTTLQRQLNVQEGGFSFSAIKPSNVKSGIYLFFVTSTQDYGKLIDNMGLPMELFLRDSGVEISNKLGANCFYAEQKIDIKGKLLSALDGMKNMDKVKLELKQCSTGIPTNIQQIEFTGRTTALVMVDEIAKVVKKQIPSLNFYFIVDYNARTSNRISCLNPIPQLADPITPMQQIGQYSAPPPPAAYGAPPPQGAYGAPPPGYGSAPPQGYPTAPPEDLSSKQLTQLKQKYNNDLRYPDEFWQQQWQQIKSDQQNAGVTTDQYVNYILIQPS
jgi:hypothetical protein